MTKFIQGGLVLILLLSLFLPRVLNLSAFQTADEKRWVSNTVGFITNLAHGDLSHLMQQPHPGITTQWLGSATVFSSSWAIRKLPLVLAQSLLVLLIGYSLLRLLDQRTAYISTLLLALNPLLIAHTRIYAMDSLLSLFLLLSILLLFLWSKTNSRRYIAFAAFTAAAAVLSKLSGLLIVPFSILLIFYLSYTNHHPNSDRPAAFPWRPLLIWTLLFLISLVLILPSLAFNPSLVISDMVSWFKSDDYQLHQIGPVFYLGTLAFLSTPLHLFAVLLLPVLLYKKYFNHPSKKLLIALLLFSLTFLVMMSLGAKKGDRYILPDFLALDIITGLIVSWLFTQNIRRISVKVACLSILALLIMQTYHVASLHPHELSYINPITRPWLGERRLGWGEGLDLAAAFLNNLPQADSLTIASYYPNEFQSNFVGHTVPIHQHDSPGVDYVIIYRAMFERGQSAWETDVVNIYRPQTPQKIIIIASVPMAWIYQK
ncbi:MAG: hypothetical protein A3E37_03335 [Candidatus Andersenbacteria bacterium RIFCSPHIGHO2_12_FULL_46_9]|nr:MAG: hypothetical protein A3B76_03040 [Candidatus Andersenbacteria bacterium RIFCSPHIGHO2_02_FULL_46_16]OGY35391.1 MAG: hypothetical protein A3E37_03335 [Candidatus Andersenbacteria bacterium RIFCSPHIGHO2_12_FULL_46_9]OGY36248.1 MAG: hypothetical protein A3I08_05360 [Candidatus Andersenbacteria bacterium RIFCSPLOWO2_02_FULL_46_11]OGY40875.1 MAG: hypothetical protein A3G57_03930 [Candidatus Andersenbacteria bacterium RIFCSPLOWO2_12_FULL_45_8]HBE89901.1 hypothetical protein [Candidatus Anderse